MEILEPLRPWEDLIYWTNNKNVFRTMSQACLERNLRMYKAALTYMSIRTDRAAYIKANQLATEEYERRKLVPAIIYKHNLYELPGSN